LSGVVSTDLQRNSPWPLAPHRRTLSVSLPWGGNHERRATLVRAQPPRMGTAEDGRPRIALVEGLAASARAKRIGSESLEDVFSELLHKRLLKLVESAVNETVEYWLKGLGDGNNGRWPELC